MAVQSSVLGFAGDACITATPSAGTSTSEITLGNDAIFAINADQDVMIRFGNPGMGAATATNYRIPANQQTVFYTSTANTSIRVFNNGSSTANIFIQKLSRY